MFYNFFRLFFLIGLRAYFKKIKVEGAENIPANTPVILLCNHQSAIMDALLTGSCFKQKIYFMARGETFSTKFKNWFMMQVNAIPIYRPDMSPGMEWKNKATMNECYKLFDKNKIIITFPEGLSFTEPRIRPLKNGMVRIALGYGDYHAFAKELVIVPMGINYEDSHKFRTQVLVKVGQPIKITDYEKLYKEKKPEAIKQMINEVKEQLEVLTLIIDKPENEIAIETAASMKGVYKESIIKDFNGLKETYSNLNVSMTDGQKSALENIAQKAKKLGTDIRTINQLQSETGWDKIKNVLVLILVFPIFLSGLVNSAIPYFLCKWMTHKFTKRADFFGSIAIICGTFVFFVYYVIYSFISYTITGNLLLSIGVLMAFPIIFLIAHTYYKFALQQLAFIRIRKSAKLKEVVRMMERVSNLEG